MRRVCKSCVLKASMLMKVLDPANWKVIGWLTGGFFTILRNKNTLNTYVSSRYPSSAQREETRMEGKRKFSNLTVIYPNIDFIKTNHIYIYLYIYIYMFTAFLPSKDMEQRHEKKRNKTHRNTEKPEFWFPDENIPLRSLWAFEKHSPRSGNREAKHGRPKDAEKVDLC